MKPNNRKRVFMHITKLTFMIKIFVSLVFIIGIILWLFK